VLVPAVGTGFGMAVLSWDGASHHPRATESGHVGYAARSEREIALLRHLQHEHGRVSLERVVSGRGLAAVYDFLRGESGVAEPPELAAGMASGDRSAEIARLALARDDAVCEQALELFVESFGAAVGDAALAHLTLGGVLIGGGVAPKILPALRGDRFREAFLDKGRFRTLLETLRVAVCLEPDTALLGAARLASRDAAS
jgi:glucokinase